jgi:hypothetical protein
MANDNTTLMIIDLWRSMPAPDQEALGTLLFDRPARVQAEVTWLEDILAGQPVAVLRPVRDRLLTDAALRLKQLNERDACYRALAGLLPAQRSGYALTQSIRREMRRYRDAGSWRFDKDRAPPADPPGRSCTAF